ncbi:sulfotransferase 6B1-like [Hypomesus transpacificus]|uniref:sulfotransferase 6B1-like n=1 Tax=Hypomesus transpacificus TaxID=137520 RepID=UPI001F084D87|nr:sulfotransferase 6B1-like [Hypomesus transpacificus]
MDKQIRVPAMSKMEDARNVKDEDKLYKFEGILYSSIMSPPDNLEALKNMEARPEDSLLVAYPKCGFNWMIIVIFKIMAATTGPKEMPAVPQMLEFFSPEIQQMVKEKPSPRLLGTHMHPDNIPKSFTEKKTKMLVVFRNPKDTVVSYYHFMNNNPVLPNAKSWDAFFTDFMKGEVAWGSYFDHALAWEKRMDDPNVMILTYEQLKENLVEGIQMVSKFFGFPLTDEQVQTIASESTFTAMKESSKNTHGGHGSVFFRKGEVEDWKNHFSEAQSKQMDDEFQRHLAGTKLGDKLKYDVYCK